MTNQEHLMTTTIPVMTHKQVEAEVRSIRNAAQRVMVDKASATRFLATVRISPSDIKQSSHRANSR